MNNENYAGVTDRIKAIFADSVVLVIFMIIVTYVFALFEDVPDNARIAAFVFIFFLYDPIFTSSFGGTLGHMMFGIRVKREKNQVRNILFPLALIRFFLKALLGWISLLTVSGNEKRKAIHDYVAGSVVIFYTKKESEIEMSED